MMDPHGSLWLIMGPHGLPCNIIGNYRCKVAPHPSVHLMHTGVGGNLGPMIIDDIEGVPMRIHEDHHDIS